MPVVVPIVPVAIVVLVVPAPVTITGALHEVALLRYASPQRTGSRRGLRRRSHQASGKGKGCSRVEPHTSRHGVFPFAQKVQHLSRRQSHADQGTCRGSIQKRTVRFDIKMWGSFGAISRSTALLLRGRGSPAGATDMVSSGLYTMCDALDVARCSPETFDHRNDWSAGSNIDEAQETGAHFKNGQPKSQAVEKGKTAAHCARATRGRYGQAPPDP